MCTFCSSNLSSTSRNSSVSSSNKCSNGAMIVMVLALLTPRLS